MRTSILILTHNRPTLFARCLNSILHDIPSNVEILVNNDSKDITEIKHSKVKYFYEQHDDLSETYKFLFDKSKGEYIYFLEDDDYVVSTFWEIIRGTYNNTIFRYIPENDFDKYYNFFKEDSNFQEHFQLGQMYFKKDCIKNFPTGNFLDNDFKLYNEISYNSVFNFSKRAIFVQTTDGKDNISFLEFNDDMRFAGDGCERLDV